MRNAASKEQAGVASQGRLGRAQESHLGSFPLNAVEDGLEGRLSKPARLARLLVRLEACAHAFGTVVEGIAERLMDGLERLALGHEDLQSSQSVSQSGSLLMM